MTPLTPKTKVKVVRSGTSTGGMQQVSWPSADAPGEHSRPVALPSHPRVELVKHADGKATILVTCTCGKRIEIACES